MTYPAWIISRWNRLTEKVRHCERFKVHAGHLILGSFLAVACTKMGFSAWWGITPIILFEAAHDYLKYKNWKDSLEDLLQTFIGVAFVALPALFAWPVLILGIAQYLYRVDKIA